MPLTFAAVLTCVQARMSRLADDIHRRQQLHQAQYDIEQQTAANGLMSATSTVIAGLQTAAAAAVDSADLRQQQLQQEQDNSAAGHQATPGEQVSIAVMWSTGHTQGAGT